MRRYAGGVAQRFLDEAVDTDLRGLRGDVERADVRYDPVARMCLVCLNGAANDVVARKPLEFRQRQAAADVAISGWPR